MKLKPCIPIIVVYAKKYTTAIMTIDNMSEEVENF